MSKVLCTFSGKYGDILWSLPTARQIARDIAGEPVDFAMMPYYESLCPLIEAQEYINKCFTIPNWIRTHSNHGDGPAEAPTFIQQFNGIDHIATVGKHGDFQSGFIYDKVFHLAYKGHPGINAPDMPLMDFTAWQQGIRLENPIPFLDVDTSRATGHGKFLVAMTFNEQYAAEKKIFRESLVASLPDVAFVDPSELSWLTAAVEIKLADLFIGCRSANWVIAMGLGKETITFEPHPSRHAACHLGRVFGCPYGRETCLPWGMPPVVAGQAAAGMVKNRMEKMYAGKASAD